jgi:hypothetical protein
MKIKLESKKVFVSLLFIIFFLLSANIVGIISTYYLDHPHIFGLVPMFDFNKEKNIPTFYSALTIVCCSILLSMIAASKRNKGCERLYWYGLAIIFLFLSIDEISSIHERLIVPVRESLNTSGVLHYAWVIPYGIFLCLFVLVFLRFLIKLPRKTMVLFIVSGTVYVSGTVGFELLAGLLLDKVGKHNIIYSTLYTCEELLEMLGIAIFIYTLISYIDRPSD